MFLTLDVGGGVIAAVLLGLFLLGLRRRLIQRPGGTFDCSLRLAPPEDAEPGGKGWVYGVARYSGDRVEWFRVFSYAFRPRRSLDRPHDRGAGPQGPAGFGGAGAALGRGGARVCPPGYAA